MFLEYMFGSITLRHNQCSWSIFITSRMNDVLRSFHQYCGKHYASCSMVSPLGLPGWSFEVSCPRTNPLIPVRLESGTCRSRTLDFTSEPQRSAAQTEICVLCLIICRQNNSFSQKDVWAFPVKAIFSICHIGFLEDRRCHCFISFVRCDNNMNERLGENKLFNERTRKTNFLFFFLTLLVVLGFNATLTAKVISWRLVTHMCFLAFSHQY